jgi:hypothetical protein
MRPPPRAASWRKVRAEALTSRPHVYRVLHHLGSSAPRPPVHAFSIRARPYGPGPQAPRAHTAFSPPGLRADANSHIRASVAYRLRASRAGPQAASRLSSSDASLDSENPRIRTLRSAYATCRRVEGAAPPQHALTLYLYRTMPLFVCVPIFCLSCPALWGRSRPHNAFPHVFLRAHAACSHHFAFRWSSVAVGVGGVKGAKIFSLY